MSEADLQSIPLLVSAALSVLLTLLWIGVHTFGLIKLASQLDQVSQRAKIAWGLSAVGGFMGPCVIVMALVGMGMALVERRSPEATDATRQAASFILAAGAVILVMTAVLLAGVGVSLAMG